MENERTRKELFFTSFGQALKWRLADKIIAPLNSLAQKGNDLSPNCFTSTANRTQSGYITLSLTMTI